MARKNKKTARILADSKAIRGVERARHFAAGGSVAEWRGRHTVTTDRRKQASKRACREKVRL